MSRMEGGPAPASKARLQPWHVAGAVLLGMLGVGARAGAQNLVVNGDFDVAQGVSSWAPDPMTLFGWSTADWQDDPTSGSGRLTNVAPCAGTAAVQCVAVPAPLAASYELGAAVFLEPPPQQASAQVRMLARDGASCGGATVGSFQGPIVNVQGQWTSFLDPGIQLPPSTQSVTILLVVTKLPFLPNCLPLPNVSARFDHVRFGPTGTTPATLRSFSVE
jgi:hypothetical protein